MVSPVSSIAEGAKDETTFDMPQYLNGKVAQGHISGPEAMTAINAFTPPALPADNSTA
ncbi:hypothetical protein LB553_24415 [Mesorhizobium sp. CA8]|uniref:hypothetical protein n=1 Tax=unclassified Mesorhizobium TaxID=325217 RepID=UPI001CCD40D2|nr:MULTISPECIES: hypothetical protein [unclassified Mesorhizobium]MBZ9764001.1 hypothetical protein [Mesorhizobium sp. CA8]MBZ9822221.1 hypothetical protein [Mesorhizobium sp. CA4]